MTSALVPKTLITLCLCSHSNIPGYTASPSSLTMSQEQQFSFLLGYGTFISAAGHTKFAPDQLFSTTGCAYKTEDVFTSDLKSICDRCATCFIVTGEKYLHGEKLVEKYSDLPGVPRLVIKAHDGMVVHENCFSAAGRSLLSMYVTHPCQGCLWRPIRR